MNLGNTPQQMRNNFEILKQKAKSLAKFFTIMQGIIVAILVIAVFGNAGFGAGIGILFAGVISVFGAYFMGYIWYFGFLKVAEWMSNGNVTAGDMAGAAVSGLGISYILGGRRGAKAAGISMLIMLAIGLSIGFYVGLFDYIKTTKGLNQMGV